MAGDTSCPCPLEALQFCCDYLNQPCLPCSNEFQPIHTLGPFHQHDSCAEIPVDETAALKNSSLPTSPSATVIWPEVNTELIGQIDQLAPGYYEALFTCCTPCWPQNTSPSEEDQSRDPPSPSSSPFPQHKSPGSSPATATKTYSRCPTSRKRGRPRLYRDFSDESTPNSCADKAAARRFVHNKVERKYRDSLNAAIKRLQRAVPTMHQQKEDGEKILEDFRPSKAMILTGAIKYIKKIECERDAALEELNDWRNNQIFSERSETYDG